MITFAMLSALRRIDRVRRYSRCRERGVRMRQEWWREHGQTREALVRAGLVEKVDATDENGRQRRELRFTPYGHGVLCGARLGQDVEFELQRKGKVVA